MSNQSSNSNLMPIVAMIAAPFVALWFGKLVAEGSYLTLGLVAAGAVGLIFLGLAHRHLLLIGITLATLDLWAAPTGFKTSAMEQTGAIALAFWLLVFWRKEFNPGAPNSYRQLSSWGFFQTATLVACAYAFLHFLFNKWNPYEPLAFGFNGAIKTYLQVYGPFLMIVAVMNSKLLFPADEKGSKILLRAFAVAYTVVFFTKLYHTIRFGSLGEEGLDMFEKQESRMAFRIPVLNVWDNLYTLRTLGPAATLVGATFYFCARKYASFLPILLIILGIAGSAISGGRAAIVFSLIFLALAVIHSGRKAEVFIGGALIAAVFTIVLVLPTSVLKEFPWFLQRSVGWFRKDLQTAATGSIQGSSEMRKDYFLYAWDYWANGDARLLLLGRSVGQMDSQDVQSFAVGNEAQTKFFAIRRLATHNGLTDTLIGWGAVGYILNITVWVSCAVMLLRLNKLHKPGSGGDCWSFIAFSFMAFWIIYMHIGGSFVWPIAIWFTLAALAHTRETPPTLNKQI